MKILLDVDGVLADFAGAVANRLGLDPNSFSTPEMTEVMNERQKEEFFYLSFEHSFCEELHSYGGTTEFYQKLLKRTSDIVIVTKPWNGPLWYQERITWLSDHFSISKDSIIFCSKKELIEGDVLIEDNAENLNKWCEAHNKPGILLNRPWNINYKTVQGVKRAKSYDNIIFHLDALKKSFGYLGNYAPNHPSRL